MKATLWFGGVVVLIVVVCGALLIQPVRKFDADTIRAMANANN